MYISFFGGQNLGAHAGIPVWNSFWIRHWVVQRVTTSGTTNDNKWQRLVKRVTTNDNNMTATQEVADSKKYLLPIVVIRKK